MRRIPIYNSRVSAPGPIPRLGDDLAAPGKALRRLGGTIAGFGENLVEREEIRRKREKEEAARKAAMEAVTAVAAGWPQA